ncbi:MAG: sugar phosphate isomerase/epimerase [Verrucomicrobia bacterium]|nr:sugar phosphate isomerase/epimerase [Verrucomicrobiota bacterium]
MGEWKIGVMIESFRLGVRAGVEKAAALGADGFQIYCTSGEMDPDAMTTERRLDFVDFVRDQGLVISALCGDLGKGLLDAEANAWVVPKCKAFVDLAVDLGTRVVTTHIGHLCDDEHCEQWRVGVPAVREVADYAADKGVAFASETGCESPEVLERFLVKVGSPGIKVNYDPANLVMNGYDHLGGVDILGEYIVHTHAKDGVRQADGTGLEMPLGQGGVDFPKYLERLKSTRYAGFLTIEREVGEDPVADVSAAIDFLRQF